MATQSGADFTVRRKDGVELSIDLDAPSPALTIGDVIDRINNNVANTGAKVTARLSRYGNGIELVDDNVGGSSSLAVRITSIIRTRAIAME